jgi:hypothetical protein
LVCDKKHKQRLKSNKSKIINCKDTKEAILKLFNTKHDKTEKSVYYLSRIWRIGEGIKILKTSLNMDHYEYFRKTSDPNNVEIRNILSESLCLSEVKKNLWNEKVCILFVSLSE